MMKSFPLTFLRRVALLLSIAVASNATVICAAAQENGEARIDSLGIKSGSYFVGIDFGSATPITVERAGKELALATQLAGGELFRAGNARFVASTREKESDNLQTPLSYERDWASFRGTIETYAKTPGLMRFRLRATTKKPTRINDSSPDFSFVRAGKSGADLSKFTIYKQQAGIEAPLVYAYSEELDSTILYFQNLTALNQYFQFVQGDPRATVRIDESGLGFRRPQGMVPGGASFVVNDAFLYLVPGRPKNDIEISKRFVQMLGEVYDHLPKPPTVYTDWFWGVAPKAARDLLDPINGIAGTRLLNSYVGRKQNEAESITNFDVLIQARKYARMSGDANARRLVSNIESEMGKWYVPLGEGRTVANNFRAIPVIDSWYYVYPIVQAAELALDGNAQAREMVLGSAPQLMRVAKAINYEFPFIVDTVGLKKVDSRFHEYDCMGSYAYIMLACHKFTGDAMYLEEAKRAVAGIADKGFKFTYEMLLTGNTMESLSWLYRLTKDERYIDIAYVPLANMLALTWMWEPDYGFAGSYQMFMGVNPLPSADQIAPFEMHMTWGSVRNFYLQTENALPPHLRKLLAEMLKHQITVGRFHIPANLPDEALSKAPDWGVLRRDMTIPVEDLKDGFHKSGMVGQEIYGSGQMFRFAADSYQQFGEDKNIVLFSEYPTTSARWNEAASTLSFRLGGTREYSSRVRLYLRGAKRAGQAARATLRRADGGKSSVAPNVTRGANYIEAFLPGGSSYQIAIGKSRAASTRARVAAAAIVKGRIAGLFGSGGVVQVKSGAAWSLPIAIINATKQSQNVAFEAQLPRGWQLQTRAVSARAGESLHRVTLRVPALPQGALQQIALWMRVGKNRTPLLQTMVRRASENPNQQLSEDFSGATIWSKNWGEPGLTAAENRNADLKIENGIATFALAEDGYTGFDTQNITLDVNEYPYIDFDFATANGQWALKIYQEGGSVFGTYIYPVMPATTGRMRINLHERTGWSGLRTFRLCLYVVGKKGDSFGLDGWRFASR